jgi:hypothetical protein
MKVTPIAHGLNLIAQPHSTRSAGLHVSDLYNGLYQELEPTRFVAGSQPNVIKMAMGLAWEQYLETQLISQGVQAERPGEFITPEGIAFSPDLLLINGHTRVGEIKLSYMSNREGIESPKFSKWLVQAKAYCHNLQIPKARFYVLYVNGNYRDNKNPDMHALDIDFSSRELKENWTMLTNFGRSKGML